MPHISETPHGGGASCNQLGGCLREPLKLSEETAQAIPPMIALHIGEAELARRVVGGDHG